MRTDFNQILILLIILDNALCNTNERLQMIWHDHTN